ncbi:MAG TPA: serine/threonine-protein kinase, partial [Fimbriimonadaceae bacterium]|nr:serine/threonine-protein kinase [Fimbriimonadaceae bacterium]
DGHTLRNEIDTKGFLPVDEAVSVATEVLKGLGHAHANGVVHRDIKPDNIQILSTGEIKITDFGIARLTFQPNLTMDGQVFGTPSYMSPEQVVGKEIDARSDLFSVGVLLYEMISGQKPFTGDSVVAITYNIMNTEPAVLNQVNHSMWQVIARALDKSPALRYSSAQEMIDALDQASRQSLVLEPAMPPPGQTIYGQPGVYPVPPPVLSPYGQPYSGGQAPAPVPPPIVYPYNPYQQGAGGSTAPHTPSYQGYPQTPIYYPPPPRQPLIRPETRNFIGKLLLFLLVMGTLVGVVILFASAVGQAWSKKQDNAADQAVVQQIASEIDTQDPTPDKIQKIETLVPQLKSPDNRAMWQHKLAVLHEQNGQDMMSKGDLADAEAEFDESLRDDSQNYNYMSDLAALYEKFAQAQPRLEDRITAYDKSIDYWSQAAQAADSLESSKHDSFMEEEGVVYYNEAYEYYMHGDADKADAAARKGMDAVPNQNSPVYQKLVDLDNRIIRGG